MQIKKLPYSKVLNFSARDKAYVEEVPALRPFYKYPVTLEAFAEVIADKQKDQTDRDTLVETLYRQHQNLEVPPLVMERIEKLRHENAFTIITAHQPSLFTGPLYYVFKIISAIKLANDLKENYPQFEFIPVFISSGEDHDFAEVNHLHLFNQTLEWESGQSGPVGHMGTDSLSDVLAKLKSVLGESEHAKHIFELIQRTHTGKVNYARAAYELAFELFKQEGLVVINTNDAALKKLFIPIIKEEIFNEVSKPLVEATFTELEMAGFPAQAMPREINFFYIKEHIRERIVFENEKYAVLNTDLNFTKSELETEIENHPERFSPNVVMRPIYQELILPNLAYVGGGGEIAYWLERKSQFSHFGINFPMLVRRDSAMWIDAGTLKKMVKANLRIKDLWKDTDRLIKEYIVENGEVEISLTEEKAALKTVYEKLANKAKAINQSLEKYVYSEHAKVSKSMDQIETRLLRAEKQNHENSIKQIRAVKEKLFPNGGLQERYDNFLPYFLKYGNVFFETLKAHFNPLDKQFKIFVDE